MPSAARTCVFRESPCHESDSPQIGCRWRGSVWGRFRCCPTLFGAHTLIASLVLTAIALLAGGMIVGTLTGRPLPYFGLRQLVLGALAVTYGIGQLIGAAVA